MDSTSLLSESTFGFNSSTAKIWWPNLNRVMIFQYIRHLSIVTIKEVSTRTWSKHTSFSWFLLLNINLLILINGIELKRFDEIPFDGMFQTKNKTKKLNFEESIESEMWITFWSLHLLSSIFFSFLHVSISVCWYSFLLFSNHIHGWYLDRKNDQQHGNVSHVLIILMVDYSASDRIFLSKLKENL